MGWDGGLSVEKFLKVGFKESGDMCKMTFWKINLVGVFEVFRGRY